MGHRRLYNHLYSELYKNMIRKEDQYFSVNRILLLAVGLWPYQQSNFTRFQRISISTIIIAIIIFQLTTFLTLRCTSELIIKVLSSASLFTSFIIKYNGFCFHLESVKNLLMHLQHIHNNLKDKNEIAIIKKYDSISRRYAIGLTILAVYAIIVMIILQLWLNMFNVDLTTNTSQSYDFLFMVEYFVDQEKYFYLILLHSSAAICIGPVTFVATGALMIAYFHHTCGMFTIANYRIENAINFNIRQNFMPKNKILMTEGIICAVDIHRQAIKLNKHFISVLEKMMFCLIVSNVACLSLNLFQLASSINDIKKLVISFISATTSIIYMFLANLMGQNIIDHNNHVFIAAYNAQWFRTPLHIQKMVLFLLQKRTKEFTLNIGGVFDASIEGFAMLVKASISYFTVICSTRS